MRSAVTGEPIPPPVPATRAWSAALAILANNSVFRSQAQQWCSDNDVPFSIDAYAFALTKPDRDAGNAQTFNNPAELAAYIAALPVENAQPW